MTTDDVEAIADIIGRHYLAVCVANPGGLFVPPHPHGRYWKCGCGAEGTHVPEGTTIKRAHHRHVAGLIATDHAAKEQP